MNINNDRPAPLVPAEVDLRDFAFMPLDVVRLRDSGLTAKASGDEFRAAVLLWCASWHQVPAASLPHDDDELANICGYSRARREWTKIRGGAMRGWVLCSDGRLYHAAVAGKALEAWIEKLASAIGGAIGNAKRWQVQIDTSGQRGQFTQAVECLRSLDPQSRTLRKKAVAVLTAPSLPESGGDTGGESGGESAPDRKGQGQGQGQGLEDKPPVPREGRAGDNPPGTAEPSPYAAVCIALKAAGVGNVSPSNQLLRTLVDAGADPAEFVAAAARSEGKDDRFAYTLAIVKGDRQRAAQTAGVIHRGPLRVVGKQAAIEEANRQAGDEWLAQQQEQTDATR